MCADSINFYAKWLQRIGELIPLIPDLYRLRASFLQFVRIANDQDQELINFVTGKTTVVLRLPSYPSHIMDTLVLPSFTSKQSVPVASIEYLEAMGNYTTVHLIGSKSIIVAITLKRFSERLPGFLRIHKGTLVNPDHIIAHKTRFTVTPYVQLSKDRQLAISRRQTKRLKPQLASFPWCTATL